MVFTRGAQKGHTDMSKGTTQGSISMEQHIIFPRGAGKGTQKC